MGLGFRVYGSSDQLPALILFCGLLYAADSACVLLVKVSTSSCSTEDSERFQPAVDTMKTKRKGHCGNSSGGSGSGARSSVGSTW